MLLAPAAHTWYSALESGWQLNLEVVVNLILTFNYFTIDFVLLMLFKIVIEYSYYLELKGILFYWKTLLFLLFQKLRIITSLWQIIINSLAIELQWWKFLLDVVWVKKKNPEPFERSNILLILLHFIIQYTLSSSQVCCFFCHWLLSDDNVYIVLYKCI